MCYTTRGPVHIARETAPLGIGAVYGADGYRSDCRHYPFNQAILASSCPEQFSADFIRKLASREHFDATNHPFQYAHVD